jgi:hypothetical protein
VCINTDLYLSNLSVGFCVVYWLIVICYMSFALCYVLITPFVFLLLVLCLLFCSLFFSFSSFGFLYYFCILFLFMYIVVCFLFVYEFTDHCHWLATQLQLINIVSYQHRNGKKKKGRKQIKKKRDRFASTKPSSLST